VRAASCIASRDWSVEMLYAADEPIVDLDRASACVDSGN
jgi:hypothetical protein